MRFDDYLRLPASRFCRDCGETIRAENRSRWGGARCRGCRAVAGARPRLLAILALTAAFAVGYTWKPAESPARDRPPVVTRSAAVPAPAQDTEPKPALHPCGARTRKGTRCKRLVSGDGFCWQHATQKPAR